MFFFPVAGVGPAFTGEVLFTEVAAELLDESGGGSFAMSACVGAGRIGYCTIGCCMTFGGNDSATFGAIMSEFSMKGVMVLGEGMYAARSGRKTLS